MQAIDVLLKGEQLEDADKKLFLKSTREKWNSFCRILKKLKNVIDSEKRCLEGNNF